jgi:hypothetical protein
MTDASQNSGGARAPAKKQPPYVLIVLLVVVLGGGLWATQTESGMKWLASFQNGQAGGQVGGSDASVDKEVANYLDKHDIIMSKNQGCICGVILFDKKIDDELLAQLAKLSQLATIDFTQSPVTDGQVNELVVKLPNLTQVILSKTGISDAALVGLAKAPMLQFLTLADTGVTDKGMADVGRLTRMINLDLSRTKVTDAGIKHLTGLETLGRFDLVGTGVSDASIDDLAKHKALTVVTLKDTKVTPEGAAKLKAALPKVKVEL